MKNIEIVKIELSKKEEGWSVEHDYSDGCVMISFTKSLEAFLIEEHWKQFPRLQYIDQGLLEHMLLNQIKVTCNVGKYLFDNFYEKVKINED